MEQSRVSKELWRTSTIAKAAVSRMSDDRLRTISLAATSIQPSRIHAWPSLSLPTLAIADIQAWGSLSRDSLTRMDQILDGSGFVPIGNSSSNSKTLVIAAPCGLPPEYIQPH